MAAPTPVRTLENLGRYARATFQVRWTQQDSDDLDNAIVARVDDLTAPHNHARFAVEKVEWIASDGIMANLEFNSMPPGPEGFIASIPWGSTSGEFDFSGFPSGCLPEPNRLSPGDIVVNTDNAVPDDNLFIHLWLKVKGEWNVAGARS